MARGIEMKDWETPEALAKLKSWSKCSKTEIARRIGISRATLDRWAAKSTKINNALVQGDVQHCNEVEDSLYTSCHDRTVVEIIHKMAYNASRGMYEEVTETRERVTPEILGRSSIIWNTETPTGGLRR